VTVEITVNHGGWFEFRLCPVNDPKVRATQECLDKYLLPMRDGQTRYHMHEGLGTQSVQLQLPKDLTCKQCFLQWKWNTGEWFFTISSTLNCHLLCMPFNAANMLGNLTPYRSMSVNKGFYISKERA